MKRLWRNKWFISLWLVFLFFVVTYSKVAYAGTDTQLDKILKAGVDGLTAYFAWLIDVLQLIW